MSDRARIMALMARREAIRLMQAQVEVGRLNLRETETAAMVERLDQVVAESRLPDGVVLTTGGLLATHALRHEIVGDRDRGAEELEGIAAALQDARATLARQDGRKSWLDQAAADAKRQAASEKLARSEAGRPAPRRGPRG